MKIPKKIKICNVKYNIRLTTTEKSELAPDMLIHYGYRWGGSFNPDKRLIELNIELGQKELIKSFFHEVGEVILTTLEGKMLNDKGGIKLGHDQYSSFMDEFTETLQKAGLI